MIVVADGKIPTGTHGYGLFVYVKASNDDVTIDMLYKAKAVLSRGKDDDEQFIHNILDYLLKMADNIPIWAVSVKPMENSKFVHALYERLSLLNKEDLFIPNAIELSTQYGFILKIQTLFERVEKQYDWVFTTDAFRAATLDQLIGLSMRSEDAFNFEYNRLHDRAIDIVHSSTVVSDDLVMFGPNTSIRELDIREDEINQLLDAGISKLGTLLENTDAPNRLELLKDFKLMREVLHGNTEY